MGLHFVAVTFRNDGLAEQGCRTLGVRLFRQLRESRGWSRGDMARALRETAHTVAATSAGSSEAMSAAASRTYFTVASIQRTIARWERLDERTAPGEYYQHLLGLLFACTPAGVIDVGPDSDFGTLLVALHHFGVSAERIEQLTALVTRATERSQREVGVERDRRPSLMVSLPQFDAAYPPFGQRERNAQNGVLLPAIVNERLVTEPVDGDVVDDAADDATMCPLSRRSAISCGLTAAAVTALSPGDVLLALQRTAAPAILGISPTDGSWAAAINQAVLNPTDAARQTMEANTNEDGDGGGNDGSDGVLRGELRLVVDRAMRVSLTSDYGALEQSLPALIGRVEATTMQPARDDRTVQQALSDVYAIVGWTLIKADIPVGAWIAVQRAIDAAERAEDIPRLAAATRCLAEVHMRAGNFEEATRTAFLAAIHLERAATGTRPGNVPLRGAALLSAAAASARRGDRREAHAALNAAAVCADELTQDGAVLATVFGPTNVAIHRVAVAIELGNAREALQHVPAVRLDRMPSVLTERRSRFLIDVARCHARLRDDQAAIDALIEAETIAPDELRHHRLTHELVPQLLTREHRSSKLRELAQRCDLLT